MYKKISLYITVVISSLLLYRYFGGNYNYSDLKDYHQILLNISGLVFTIMGIWIAFLYPNSLMKIVNPGKIETVDFSDALEDTKRLESIVGSVLKSAVIATSIMFFLLLKILFFDTNFYKSNITELKQVALSITILLTYLQVEAIFQVITSNISFINHLHHKREDKESDNKL